MERKRRYGAPHLYGQNPGTPKAAWPSPRPCALCAKHQKGMLSPLLFQQRQERRCKQNCSGNQ